MTKKIIFFDADGTLWYPHATKRTSHPVWLYIDKKLKHDYLNHLILTPQAVETIKSLRKSGMTTVILSMFPHEPGEAVRLLNERVNHFELADFFDEVHATAERPEAKAEKMLEILKRHNLTIDDALMVGDSYEYDYAPARSIGVDSVLVNSDYHQENKENEPAETLINDLNELLPLLGLQSA